MGALPLLLSDDVARLMAGGMIALWLVLVAVFYSLPAIGLFRKGHYTGGAICLIVMALMLLGMIASAASGDAKGSLASWFLTGGGFLWLLLLVWSAGAPDLVYRRKQQQIVDDLRQRIQRIGRAVYDLETAAARQHREVADMAPPPPIAQFVEAPPQVKIGESEVADTEPTPLYPARPVPATDEPQAQRARPDPDATPIAPMEPIRNSGAQEIKVRCQACGKKFSGLSTRIEALKACPRCKAVPFVFESA